MERDTGVNEPNFCKIRKNPSVRGLGWGFSNTRNEHKNTYNNDFKGLNPSHRLDSPGPC